MPPLVLHSLPIIVMALFYGFLNGKNGSANVVAPLISTRALSYRKALFISAIAGALGPFLFGLAVAETLGRDVLAPDAITLPVIAAGTLSATLWTALALSLGLPSSTSHALVGGLIGAGTVAQGTRTILMHGLRTSLLALFLAPVLSILAGYWVVRLLYFLLKNASPRVNGLLQRGEVLAAIAVAIVQGSNDTQKTMGMITLGLLATGSLTQFRVPPWAVVASAGAFAGGTLFAGQRTTRTVGRKYYRIRPVHGLGALVAAALVILGAGLFGGPVSTSHVISSSIVGAGSADRVQMIRWGVVQRILWSWLLTIPASALVAGLLYLVLRSVI